MAHFYLYLSIFGSFFSIFIISQSIFLGRILSLCLYLLMSIPWVLYMGFCGQDMRTYLALFADYNFNNPFTWSYLEFSVGLITSFLKILLPINSSPETIATAYRLFVFAFLPSVIIFSSPNKLCSTLRFLPFLLYISLCPYTFLSASNIINNGLSISLIFYFVISAFSYNASLLTAKFNISLFEYLLLFFAAFAHPFGLGVLIFGILSLFAFNILRRIRLINFTSKISTPLRYSILLLPPSFISASLSVSFLSSRVQDDTILLSSIVLIVCVYLLWLSVNRSFFLLDSLPASFVIRFIGTYKFKLFVLSFFIFFSFYVVFLGLLGGGDAAERFIGSLINWSLIITLLFSLFISLSPALHYYHNLRLSNISLSFTSFLSLSLLCLMCLYFYNSDAFWLNIPVGGVC